MSSESLTILKMEAVSLLKKLIATPSFSREEEKTRDILIDFFLSKGITAFTHLNNV